MIDFIKRVIRTVFLMPIIVYRSSISPLLPNTCIYRPTCSSYAMDAVQRHGIIKGFILAFSRITRCHGLYEGGNDPVPDHFSWKYIREMYRRAPVQHSHEHEETKNQR